MRLLAGEAARWFLARASQTADLAGLEGAAWYLHLGVSLCPRGGVSVAKRARRGTFCVREVGRRS